MIEIIEAKTNKEIQSVKDLFIEYAESLDFKLCFQNFNEELKNLPGDYLPPGGILLLAINDGFAAGCAALRKINDEICEMKRLYVRDKFRGLHIGINLANRLITEANKIGYKIMRLDTVPSMKTAQKLYKSLGFYEITPYRYNPVEGAVYMELKL